MSSLAHTIPAITAAFLASLVAAVEALTIVLAVATVPVCLRRARLQQGPASPQLLHCALHTG